MLIYSLVSGHTGVDTQNWTRSHEQYPDRQASLNSVHWLCRKCYSLQQELEAEAEHGQLTLVPGAISSVMNGIGENSMATASHIPSVRPKRRRRRCCGFLKAASMMLRYISLTETTCIKTTVYRNTKDKYRIKTTKHIPDKKRGIVFYSSIRMHVRSTECRTDTIIICSIV